MKALKKKFTIFAVLAAFTLAAYLAAVAGGQEDKTKVPKLGAAAPELVLEDLGGKTFKLSELKGKKGVVLVFFATWCPYCVREVPQLIGFQKEYVDEKLALYGVNIKQSKKLVERFATRHGINYPILLDIRAKAALDYGVRGIPLIVGIDGNGVIRYREHGLPHDKRALERLRDRLTQGVKAAKPPEKGEE